jgi:hypothetical protein
LFIFFGLIFLGVWVRVGAPPPPPPLHPVALAKIFFSRVSIFQNI